MPSDYEQHKTATGKFQPMLINILPRKAIREKMKVRGIRPARGVILSVSSIMILLLRCNDVDRNPDQMIMQTVNLINFPENYSPPCKSWLKSANKMSLWRDTRSSSHDTRHVFHQAEAVLGDWLRAEKQQRHRTSQQRIAEFGALHAGVQTGIQPSTSRYTPLECQNWRAERRRRLVS